MPSVSVCGSGRPMAKLTRARPANAGKLRTRAQARAQGTRPAAAPRRDRGRARRPRARHPHAADRHPGAGRIARRLRSGERERDWANAIKSGAEHLAALTTLVVDAARADAAGLVLRNEPFSPRALAEAVGAGAAARAPAKEHQGRRSPSRAICRRWCRRCVAAARGAGKPHRQCGEIHRTQGVVSFSAGAEPAARGRTAADLHGRRQRHRHDAERIEAAVPPVRAGERCRSPAATAAPVSGCCSSSGSPRRWAATSRSPARRGSGSSFRLTRAGRARRRTAASPSEAACGRGAGAAAVDPVRRGQSRMAAS